MLFFFLVHLHIFFDVSWFPCAAKFSDKLSRQFCMRNKSCRVVRSAEFRGQHVCIFQIFLAKCEIVLRSNIQMLSMVLLSANKRIAHQIHYNRADIVFPYNLVKQFKPVSTSLFFGRLLRLIISVHEDVVYTKYRHLVCQPPFYFNHKDAYALPQNAEVKLTAIDFAIVVDNRLHWQKFLKAFPGFCFAMKRWLIIDHFSHSAFS